MNKNYGAVFIQTELGDGLSKGDYLRLLNILPADVDLVTLSADGNNSSAYGFSNLDLMEAVYLSEEEIEEFVSKIIADLRLENETHEYELKPGFIVYIGYISEDEGE